MEQNDTPKLIDKTLSNLRRAWKEFASAARVKLTGTVRADLPGDDCQLLKRQIDACLEGLGGEVSARAQAADLGRTYISLNAQGRKRFLQLLAREYDVDEQSINRAITAWNELDQYDHKGNAKTNELRRSALAALRESLTPPRVRLLAQFNGLPQGIKFLVDMRAELIDLARKNPALKSLDDDLKCLFTSWFDVGFLDLQCITWDAPASLLEKLARYEAVHPVKSWTDIKNRLASDRRCYAFFHPLMPDEPLIYVWVALVKGISDNVQTLLDVRAPTENPSDADTAIFYSISNAQSGLAGVSFGSFLIKRVVDALANDFKNLKNFSTLSPIPGFCTWFDEQLNEKGVQLLLPHEQRNLSTIVPENTDLLNVIRDPNTWNKKPELEEAVQEPLMRLCALYLSEAKRGRFARDRVAHFHLSNGARMERINWRGDTSPKGMRQAVGMMINYLYKSSDIEKNHESYTGNGRIRTSSGFRALLKT